ncbi:glycosyltransferase [Calothrix rhizosoleniae]|uniref:glycosyltransferase n=1 Tax=Calothrix rhizosoleniae TaxID=888997 RepID=UPI000B49D9E5|nr:glycosyltransferase [Calothrix rhizosoleniae]
MRKLYFLVPGTDGKFACGGLWAELKALELAKQVCSADVVTYRQREPDKLFLDDLLQTKNQDEQIFVISWGFDVPKLSAKLTGCNLVYHAHTAGYGFSLPASIPIITVSRNSMGYWGQKSPNSLIYYLPNQISDEFHNYHQERDIDVLVLARKSSEYLIKQLVPDLQQRCNVFVVNSYIDDMPGLFNRAKIYLYDSAEYWAQRGVSEGFGLQPLEALACGCHVFSSVNGGLSDYLDPGFNCYKIAAYSQEFDIQRILKVLANWQPFLPETLLSEYRAPNIIAKLQFILDEINVFFDSQNNQVHLINELTQMRLAQLKFKSIVSKINKKYFLK